jgi:putative colanic acid biosynthesis glycosyltransferase
MPAPLISILIVCRNPGVRLRDALASVWAQTFSDHEIVVIDGDSTDGTAEWLSTVRPRLGALHSGPDAGIYDAMNHALRLARGEWILFLGADDRLATSDILDRAAPSLRAASPGTVAHVGEARYDDGRRYRFDSVDRAIRRNFVHHQACFYRRENLLGAGCFDTSLRLMADYDLNLRLLRSGAEFVPLPAHVADCASGGASDSGRWLGYREEISVRARHFPGLRRRLWDAAACLRYLRKRILRLAR